jgi:hypothetical protein
MLLVQELPCLGFVETAKFQDVIDYLFGMWNVDFLEVLVSALESISQSVHDLDMSLCDFLFVVF